MTLPSTLTGEQAVTPALVEQHNRWAQAHHRLYNAKSPPPKPMRPRPVSPFIRAREERKEEALAEVEQFEPLVVVPEWRTIAREVAEKHGVLLVDIISPRRDQKSVRARHEIMWRCRHETALTLPQIGRRLGGRDHTTILHGIWKHEQRMAEAAQ